MPPVPKPPLLVAICCSALLFTGCGGSDKKDSSASTVTTGAETTSSSESTATTVAETPTSAAAADGAAGAASGHDGKVGDKLITEGFRDDMEKMAIKVTEVIDPADAIMTAARYKTDADKRFVIVRAEFTNLGPNPYDTSPDLNMVLVDDRNQEYRKSIATGVDGCPNYPHEPLATNATASGCTFFELAKATPVVAVRWSPRSDLTDRTLTWKR